MDLRLGRAHRGLTRVLMAHQRVHLACRAAHTCDHTYLLIICHVCVARVWGDTLLHGILVHLLVVAAPARPGLAAVHHVLHRQGGRRPCALRTCTNTGRMRSGRSAHVCGNHTRPCARPLASCARMCVCALRHCLCPHMHPQAAPYASKCAEHCQRIWPEVNSSAVQYCVSCSCLAATPQHFDSSTLCGGTQGKQRLPCRLKLKASMPKSRMQAGRAAHPTSNRSMAALACATDLATSPSQHVSCLP